MSEVQRHWNHSLMKCLVTGGLGFIGSNLVEKLTELDYNITIWDNADGPAQDLPVVKNVDISQLSTSQYKSLDREFDIIFHLAALSKIQPSFNNPKRTHDINVTGTVEILEVAKKCGAKVVYAGSSSFYYDQYANPYAYTKWIGEECCKLYNKVYNVPVAIARFFNAYGPACVVYGPYSSVVAIFEDQIANNKSLTITGTGEQRRDFIHVYDVVNALVAMSEKKWNAKIFNVGYGQNVSINELAQMFKPKEIVSVPARCGEADVTLAGIDLTKEELNWEPVIAIEQYIEDFINGQV